ncbi:hypothetical protein LI328DRAFT_130451 [Trichoderma asperelloides]|nr:hypothetical protein LI328DRAFT_130451 [Trichoderma asperelloides]
MSIVGACLGAAGAAKVGKITDWQLLNMLWQRSKVMAKCFGYNIGTTPHVQLLGEKMTCIVFGERESGWVVAVQELM